MYSNAQTFGLRPAVFSFEFFRKADNRVDPIRDAPPCPLEPSWVALAVDAERGMVLAFDEEVSSLVTIRAPRLDRERLVQIVFVPGLLVGLGDYGADRLGRRERPIDESSQKGKLKGDRGLGGDLRRAVIKSGMARTRSTAVMEAKVRSPATGFLPSHCAGHWFR